MIVRGIKLVTGEELVAEIVSATENAVRAFQGNVPTPVGLTVKNPLVMRMQQGKDGLVCNFFPWTIIAEGSITLNPAAVIADYPVPNDVESSYITNTTGLSIVSAVPSQILHS